MITPKRLFKSRIHENAVFQWKAIRMVMDWTVALYIIIPALLVAGYHYFQAFQEPPAIIALLPVQVILFAAYLFAVTGTLRYFVEEADQIVLSKAPSWIQMLRKRGFVYTVSIQTFLTLLLFILLLPVLILFFQAVEVVILAVLTLMIKMNYLLAVQIFDQLPGWKAVLRRVLLWIAGWAVYALGGYLLLLHIAWGLLYGLLLTVSLIFLWKDKLKSAGDLERDILRERKAKLRYVGLWIGYATPIRPKPTRKRPLLFRSSNRLFKRRNPVNGLAEVFIKLFFRSSSGAQLYLQFIGICSFAIFALPLSMKWVMWAVSAFLLAYMVKLNFKDARETPFLQMFALKGKVLHEALTKSLFLTILPGILIISTIFGAIAFPWWGTLIMLTAGGAVSYVAANVILMSEVNKSES